MTDQERIAELEEEVREWRQAWRIEAGAHNALQTEFATLQAIVDRLSECGGFAMSMARSGEKETDQSREMFKRFHEAAEAAKGGGE